jgi:hypothetical protein
MILEVRASNCYIVIAVFCMLHVWRSRSPGGIVWSDLAPTEEKESLH